MQERYLFWNVKNSYRFYFKNIRIMMDFWILGFSSTRRNNKF